MEPKQNGSTAPDQPVLRKKLYHKPVVSVYGNLAEVTKTVSNPVTHHMDGGCWAGGASPART